MIKMVVVDMDGTFLRDDRTYDQKLFQQLFERMQQRGIRFVAASGSQFQRLQNEFSPYLDQMDFISQNGALVHRGQALQQIFQLEDDRVHQVVKDVQMTFTSAEIGQILVAGLHGAYLSRETDPRALEMARHYYRPIHLVDRLIDLASDAVGDQFTKIAVSFFPGTDFDKLATKLQEIIPADLSAENSGFNTTMIGLAQANKRTGIETLKQVYGIRDAEVVVFGDNENDLPMFAMTPNSYAMKNAGKSIREAAAYVTEFDNNQDGVLKTLATLLQ